MTGTYNSSRHFHLMLLRHVWSCYQGFFQELHGPDEAGTWNTHFTSCITFANNLFASSKQKIMVWTWPDKPYGQHGWCSPWDNERDGDRSSKAVWWREKRPETEPADTQHVTMRHLISHKQQQQHTHTYTKQNSKQTSRTCSNTCTHCGVICLSKVVFEVQ